MRHLKIFHEKNIEKELRTVNRVGRRSVNRRTKWKGPFHEDTHSDDADDSVLDLNDEPGVLSFSPRTTSKPNRTVEGIVSTEILSNVPGVLEGLSEFQPNVVVTDLRDEDNDGIDFENVTEELCRVQMLHNQQSEKDKRVGGVEKLQQFSREVLQMDFSQDEDEDSRLVNYNEYKEESQQEISDGYERKLVPAVDSKSRKLLKQPLRRKKRSLTEDDIIRIINHSSSSDDDDSIVVDMIDPA